MTLNETLAEYKKRAKVAFFPCNKCATCNDYRPQSNAKLNQPCAVPWPKCKCKHTAQDHQPPKAVNPTK